MRLWNPKARRVKVSHSGRFLASNIAANKPGIARIGLALAGSVLIHTSPALAEPTSGGKGQAWQQLKLENPGIERNELRQLFKVQWNNANQDAVRAIAQPIFDNNSITQTQTSNQSNNLVNFARNEARAAEQALKFQQAAEERAQKFELKEARNLQKQEVRDSARNFNNTVQQISADKYVNVNGGLSLDLGSAVETITLGDKLFQQGSSITITVGGESKTLAAGSKVTAAEYIAAKQVIATGGQKLGLDGDGRAISGAVDLSELTPGDKTMKVNDFVVPVNVSASGDFGKQGDVRISGDLINNGSIQAFSSDKNFASATIRADNITNNADASISSILSQNTRDLGGVVSDLELNLHADDSLRNFGSIESGGDLTLSAGKMVTNSGQAIARNNLHLQAPSITNSGRFESLASNINIDSSSISALNVNNAEGTLAALDGAINIRNADYVAPFNTLVSGGDLLSKEVNVYTGGGTSDVFVNELTGIINTSGSAAHVSVNTSVLTIGKQCLIGDPTYFNTGDIVLDGDIVVGEKLAIISGGNITATSNVSQITARNLAGQGFDISIVAGANITSATGPTYPSAGGPVTITFSGAPGGDIDFSGASSSLSINSNSTSANSAGGNILLAAFGNGAVGGQILLPSTGSINASGTGTATNGNVYVVAPNKITLGSINSYGGSGGQGSAEIYGCPVKGSVGLTITYDANGNVVSGNRISTGTPTLPSNAEVQVGEIDVTGNLTIRSGGDISTDNLTSRSGDVWVSGEAKLTVKDVYAYNYLTLDNSYESAAVLNVGNLISENARVHVGSYGHVTTGDIDAYAGVYVSSYYGTLGAGIDTGDIICRAATIYIYSLNNGASNVGDLTAYGNVTFNSMGPGASSAGNVTSTHGAFESNTSSSTFELGNVFAHNWIGMNARSNVTIGNLTSETGGVRVFQAKQIIAGDISAHTEVTLSTATDGITIGSINTAGHVSINAFKNIQAQDIEAGAAVSITNSVNGSVGTITAGAVGSTNSTVTVNSKGQIALGNVSASGDVSIINGPGLQSGVPRVDITAGNITSDSGTVVVDSYGRITVGTIKSYGFVELAQLNLDVNASIRAGNITSTAGSVFLTNYRGGVEVGVLKGDVVSLLTGGGADVNVTVDANRFGSISEGSLTVISLSNTLTASGTVGFDKNITFTGADPTNKFIVGGQLYCLGNSKISLSFGGGVTVNSDILAKEIVIDATSGTGAIEINNIVMANGVGGIITLSQSGNFTNIGSTTGETINLNSTAGSIGELINPIQILGDNVSVHAFGSVYLTASNAIAVNASTVGSIFNLQTLNNGSHITVNGDVTAGSVLLATSDGISGYAGSNVVVNSKITANGITLVSSDQDVVVAGSLVATGVHSFVDVHSGRYANLAGSNVTATNVTVSSSYIIQSLGRIVTNNLTLSQVYSMQNDVFVDSNVTADSVNLHSSNDIGNPTVAMQLGAGVASVSATSDNGSIYLQSARDTVSGFSIRDIDAEHDFVYLGAGTTNISGDITTKNGNIYIATAKNKINVNSFSVVQANGTTAGNGNISLVVLDTSKSAKKNSVISFAQFSELHTDAIGSDGDILISVGPLSAPVVGKAPKKNVNVILQGGAIFWGKKSAKFDKPTSTFQAKGANIILNNPFDSKSILFSGSTIDADPPVDINTPVTVITSQASSLSSQGIPSLEIPPDVLNSANNSHSISFGFPEETNAVFPVNAGSSSVLLVSSNLPLLSNSSSLLRENEVRKLAFGSKVEDDNSYAVGTSTFTGEKDAAICSDAEFGLITGINIPRIQHGENIKLSGGNVLFAPTHDTQIETPQGNIHIGAHAIALISLSEAGLAVFDLDDQHKGSVSVESHGHNVVLSPGRHVLITPHHQHEFAQLNAIETISHRGLTSTVKNGHRAHISEFSVISALDSVKPLKAIVASNHPHARKVAARMLKTTAIIMQIGGTGGQYQHYFKPRMTAMSK